MGPLGPALALSAKLVLAGALLVAALAKLRDRAALPALLAALGLPDAVVEPLALGLPMAEAVVAAALTLFPHSGVPAWVAAGLLVGFTGVLLASRDRDAPCPCFGAVSTRTGTLPGVVRNVVLLAVAVLATGSVDGVHRAGLAIVLPLLAAAVAVVIRVAR